MTNRMMLFSTNADVINVQMNGIELWPAVLLPTLRIIYGLNTKKFAKLELEIAQNENIKMT